MEELTEQQRAVIEAIYREFHEHGTWPMFGLIDRPFRREYGTDAASVLLTIPDTVVSLPHAASRPTRTDLVRLTLHGLALCSGAEEDLERFATLLRWLAKRETEYEPGPAGEDPTVHSTEVSDFLELKPDDGVLVLVRLHTMLQLDYWGTNLSGTSHSHWSVTLGPEIWRFRNVQSVEDCLRVRAEWKAEAHAVTMAPRPNPYGYAAPVADPEQAKDDPYVDEKTIKRLQDKCGNAKFDLSKLLALIEELNDNHATGNLYSTLALIRTILNHVPPIFERTRFEQVASEIPWPPTDAKHIKNFSNFRPLGDDALHRPISQDHDVLSPGDIPPPAWLRTLLLGCAARL